MTKHYVLFRINSSYEELLAVVHFERHAKNICEFLNNNYCGLYYYKEVDNHDLYTRYQL